MGGGRGLVPRKHVGGEGGLVPRTRGGGAGGRDAGWGGGGGCGGGAGRGVGRGGPGRGGGVGGGGAALPRGGEGGGGVLAAKHSQVRLGHFLIPLSEFLRSFHIAKNRKCAVNYLEQLLKHRFQAAGAILGKAEKQQLAGRWGHSFCSAPALRPGQARRGSVAPAGPGSAPAPAPVSPGRHLVFQQRLASPWGTALL